MRITCFCGRAILVLVILLAGWKFGRHFNSCMLVLGHSMEPTLYAGQVVKLTRSSPLDIQRGTIVLSSGRGLSIKRVIGLPNETISFSRGEVFINGRMLYEPYLLQSVTTYSWECQTLVTTNDEFVLLGDNRLISEDSRQHGVVLRREIIGVLQTPWIAPELLDKPHYRISGKDLECDPEEPLPGVDIERWEIDAVNGS